jgi:hypothetical protein
MQINRSDNISTSPLTKDPLKEISSDNSFIKEKAALLLKRFHLSFIREENRIEYFVTSRESEDEVSFSLVFCHDLFAKQLHVSKFYPGLFRQPNTRYLSAACFFLLVNHCTVLFNLGPDQSIFLQCKKQIFEEFYARLNEFTFTVTRSSQGDNVDIKCPCPASTRLDTTMIIEQKPCLP